MAQLRLEKSKRNVKHGFKRSNLNRLIVGLMGVLLVTSPAQAGLPNKVMPNKGILSQITEISDADLGQMRGKYVAPGQVMYFGVEMVTQWIAASGELISASGNLEVNLAGSNPQVGFRPIITVEQYAPTADSTNYGSEVVSGGAGLQNVNGVVQNIQVAGVSNGISNNVGLNVKFSSSAPPSDSSLKDKSPNISAITPNGSIASVGLTQSGLRVSVAVPNQGQALQQIRNGSNGGQLLQSVQLAGNLNQIQNMIHLSVQFNALDNGLQGQTGQMLQALRSLPPSALF